MGDVKKFPPTMRLVAAFSRHPESLHWLWEKVDQSWGTILLKSNSYRFVESEYYLKSMGDNLLKQFAVLDCDYDPADLASDKLLTNDWESEYQRLRSTAGGATEMRSLNIDPGYMSLTKLVLASTKNREHRLYLRDGIYAEVTLAFRNQRWNPMEWTYPDYQRSDFQEFFSNARNVLLKHRS